MSLPAKPLLLLTALLLLAGCSTPATPPPTAGPLSGSATPEPTATPTAAPTELPTAASTAAPPLRTTGPYLAYFRQLDEQQLVLLDADGMGRKVIPVPPAATTDIHFLSPDGKWLAYYLGSASDAQASDLTLNLLDLQSGETQLVSKLLSKDYPDNFVRAAKDLHDPNLTAERLQDAFLNGITRSAAWSPDGHTLAFAGQMDGPSSDLYVYDVETKAIQRKSSGAGEVQWVGWSPDGKWIVYASVLTVGEGMTFDIYSTPMTGTASKDLIASSGAYSAPALWVDNHQFLDHESANGPGDYRLRLVDVATGKITRLWDGIFQGFEVDAQKGLLVIYPLTKNFPDDSNTTDLIPGPYLIDLKSGRQTSLDQSYATIYAFDMGDHRFLLQDSDTGNTYFVSPNGALTPGVPDVQNVSVAPDQQHWVSTGDRLKVFGADDTLIDSLDLPFDMPAPDAFGQTNNPVVVWKPDSSGLFISVDNGLYVVDLLGKRIDQVETDDIANQGLAFIWVGRK